MHRQVCGVDVDMSMEKMKSYGDIRRFSHESYFKRIDSIWGASVSIPYDNVSFSQNYVCYHDVCVIVHILYQLYLHAVVYFACCGVFCMICCVLHGLIFFCMV